MNRTFTKSRREICEHSAFLSLLTVLTLALCFPVAQGNGRDSIATELRRCLQTDTSGRAGILFGRLDSASSKPQIWTEGAIGVKNDLRLGCPTSKPCLAFIVLKEGIDLGTTIDRWFPEDSGFTNSHLITIKHLLLNSSGIRDYVPLIPMHLDSAVTPTNSIDRAYRNQALLFSPGTGWEYSNTNFNIVGRILELQTGKPIPQLFHRYFDSYAPSLRLDDGKGNYPRGYPKLWPYHWSSPGFAGGFIGTAIDAMRAFTYITSQPEFKVITHWYHTDGSFSNEPGRPFAWTRSVWELRLRGCRRGSNLRRRYGTLPNDCGSHQGLDLLHLFVTQYWQNQTQRIVPETCTHLFTEVINDAHTFDKGLDI